MNNVAPVLARRYAQAFYNVYGKQLSADDIKRIKLIDSYIRMHKPSLILCSLPHCTENEKKIMIGMLLQSLGDTITKLQPLIDLLISHKRTLLIGLVLRLLRACYYQEHAIECFSIITSHSITEDDIHALHTFLEQKTGNTIEVMCSTDQSLIAGIRMQSDAHIWEYSVRKQLHALSGAYID